MARICVTLIVAVAICSTFVVEAAAQNPTFPASWEGSWAFTFTKRDCDTGDILTVSFEGKTIITGDLVKNFDPDMAATNGQPIISDTELGFIGGDIEIIGNCTYTTGVVYNLARTGNYINGVKTITLIAEGVCPGNATECDFWHITAVRAVAPVESQTWGAIKALYE